MSPRVSLRQRATQHHVVALGQQLAHRGIPHSQRPLRFLVAPPVAVQHLHLKSRRPPRHLPANPPQADDPQRRPVNLAPQNVSRVIPREFRTPRIPVPLRQPPSRRQAAAQTPYPPSRHPKSPACFPRECRASPPPQAECDPRPRRSC